MKYPILLLAPFLLFANFCLAKTEPSFPKGFQQQTSNINFTENKGQIHDQNYASRADVLYGVMTGNLAVHIRNSGVSYQLYKVDRYKEVEDLKTREKRKDIDQQTIYRIDLNWINSNKNITQTEDIALPGYNNYYFENCPKGALYVKSYSGITLNNLYNGINLHYYEKNGELKHDYIVAPHSSYQNIQIQVKGANVAVSEDGSLILSTPLGKIQEGAPLVFQNGKQLHAKWIVKNDILSFAIDNYDANYQLVIDPITRLWGTYYGGSGDDVGRSCATDVAGNAFMAGITKSNSGFNIATTGGHQTTFGGGTSDDGFLAKFNKNGVRLWGTYYGGSLLEDVYSCATDTSGNVYLAGTTTSTTGAVIATALSHQALSGGGQDAFLVKFNAAGIRLWGTYYGGNGNEQGMSCTTDYSGNVYMAGTSSVSSTTANTTPGSHQPLFGGGMYDAFLVKFDANGNRQWGTYYGGNGSDFGYCCAADLSGNVFLSGHATSNTSTVIATPGAQQTTYSGGGDAFLVGFNSNGIRLWGTYYGGVGGSGFGGFENGTSCATDALGNVYLAGVTSASTTALIATPGSHQSSFAGFSGNAFLAKFNSLGIRQWGTYYGGPNGSNATSCSTDGLGNVYLAGNTGSVTGTVIATIGSHQPASGGNNDAFLAKFNSNGVRQSGTYYGAFSNDYGNSCAVHYSGIVYLAGYTDSNVSGIIATNGSQQSLYGGGTNDAFLVKFDACDVAPSQPTAINGPTTLCAGTITSYSSSMLLGATNHIWSQPSGWVGSSNTPTLVTTSGISGTMGLSASNACGVSPQQTVFITVNPKPIVSVNSGAICFGQSFTLIPNGANTYTYANAGPMVTSTVSTTYTVTGTNAAGCTNSAVSSVVVFPLPTIAINGGIICVGQSFTMQPAGAFSYSYLPGGPVVSPTLSSSYSITGTSASGCLSSNTAVCQVTVSASPIPTITVNSGNICLGKSFTISPSGANTYTIQGGATIVSPNTTTSFTVAGTSISGCISSNIALANVTVNQLPIVDVTTSSSVICVGEEATLNANGAISYTFNPGGVGASVTVAPNIATSYTVIGTDANGCSNFSTITQKVDECLNLISSSLATAGGFELYPNPTQGIINLNLYADHEITVRNTIGQIVYSSAFSAGEYQINFENLAKGVYFVTVWNERDSKTSKLIKE